MTRSRIDRSLLHILLDIKSADLAQYASCGDVFYARILGFCKSATPLLGHLKKVGTLPLLSKLADAEDTLKAAYGSCPDDAALHMLKQDIFAAHLYESVVAQKIGSPIKNEYRRQIVMHP